MRNPMSFIMRLVLIAAGLYLVYLIICAISWKIYNLIYSSYILGQLFPYPNYNNIVKILCVIFILLAVAVVRIIVKMRKR